MNAHEDGHRRSPSWFNDIRSTVSPQVYCESASAFLFMLLEFEGLRSLKYDVGAACETQANSVSRSVVEHREKRLESYLEGLKKRRGDKGREYTSPSTPFFRWK